MPERSDAQVSKSVRHAGNESSNPVPPAASEAKLPTTGISAASHLVRVPEVPNAPILIVLAVVTAPFIVGWADAVALQPPAPLCPARQGSNYSARSGSFSVLPPRHR
jgi:hypothetical protein